MGDVSVNMEFDMYDDDGKTVRLAGPFIYERMALTIKTFERAESR